MNIESIEVGNEYKNYAKLCLALGIEPKTGRTKQFQIKKMNQYFTFEIDGRKHTIVEVFDQPKVIKKKVRQKDDMSIWSEKALIHLLATTPSFENNNRVVRITKLDLFEALGFINPFYRDGHYNRKETSDALGVSSCATNHYFDSTYDKSRKRVESLLKRMRDSFNIDYTLVKIVCDINGNHRQPTNEEIGDILDINREILDEMGLDSLAMVIYKNRYTEYKVKASPKFASIGIKYVYECYEIVVGSKYMKTIEQEYDQQLKDGITLKYIQEKINQLAFESNHKTFESRHDRAIESRPTWGKHSNEIDEVASSLTFMQDGDKLFQTCSSVNPTFDLSSSITKIKEKNKKNKEDKNKSK